MKKKYKTVVSSGRRICQCASALPSYSVGGHRCRFASLFPEMCIRNHQSLFSAAFLEPTCCRYRASVPRAAFATRIIMTSSDDVREILSLQQEIDSVTKDMSSLMTNDSSQFFVKKCPEYFESEVKHSPSPLRYVRPSCCCNRTRTTSKSKNLCRL